MPGPNGIQGGQPLPPVNDPAIDNPPNQDILNDEAVNPENEINNLQNPDVNPGDGINNPQDPAVNPQQEPVDPGLGQAIQNDAPNQLAEGNGQAQGFAARHEVQTGKDWDLTQAKGLLELTQNSVNRIKEDVSGTRVINDFANEMMQAVDNAISAHPGEQTEALVQDLSDLIATLGELKHLRKGIVKDIKDGSGNPDPDQALADIRKSLRVFRYGVQKTINEERPFSGHIDQMGHLEGAMRSIQNAFADNPLSKETLDTISELERRAAVLTGAIHNKLAAIAPEQQRPLMPDKFTLMSTIGKTLKLSHRTNDQIRGYQDAKSNESRLRGMLEPITRKGGSHKVTFSAGVGALIGLGFSSALVAGVRAGARVQIEGDVTCSGANKPLEVTFRITGGLEGKLLAKVMEKGGPKGEVSADALLSRFVTRSYASLDDLILDADRCKMATARTIGGVIVGALKSFGLGIGRLGTKLFRLMGRHAGDTMQSNQDYLNSLKRQGVISHLDSLLEKRANAVIVAERKGFTGQLLGEASGKMEFSSVVSAGASVKAQYQRDFSVKGNTFAPLAQNIRGAGREQLLAMRRPLQDGVTMPQIPQGVEESDLTDAFNRLVDDAAQNKPRGTEQWAQFANQIRSLMIAVELLHIDGEISREEADRLLTRFSNPKVKMPPDIFREYLMEGSGNSKPAKIRKSFSIKIKASLFKSDTDSWTGGLSSLTQTAADSFIKGVADAGVAEFRQQVGLDSSIQYSYSSEKPVNPGSDPRPWENVTKTSHSLTVSASIPFRTIVDVATRIAMKKGEPADMPSEHTAGKIAKDIAKDSGKSAASGLVAKAIPKIILASVKEGLKAAVMKWLSDPKNVEKLVQFVADHADDALNTIIRIVEYVVTHPAETLQTALTAYFYVAGTTSTSESERLKTLKWDFEDDKLTQFSVGTQTTNKLGFDVDPVGVGLGVGFDLSYSVNDSLTERKMLISSSLTTLMSHTENYMLTNTNVTANATSNQNLKNYLSANLDIVKQVVADLNSEKNTELYNTALLSAQGDPDLQEKMQNARQRLASLGPDAPNDAVVDAMHDLLITMTTSYRTMVA